MMIQGPTSWGVLDPRGRSLFPGWSSSAKRTKRFFLCNKQKNFEHSHLLDSPQQQPATHRDFPGEQRRLGAIIMMMIFMIMMIWMVMMMMMEEEEDDDNFDKDGDDNDDTETHMAMFVTHRDSHHGKISDEYEGILSSAHFHH